MSSIKNWISAFRLRTLFLAVAGVTLGTGVALHEGKFSTVTLLLTLALAIFIQILANLANDLGDYEKGADTTGKRQGPTRAMQSGKISRKEMISAIILFAVLVSVTGICAIGVSVGWNAGGFAMLGIGVSCMLAAIFYTMGKFAYGYKGWGDFFAFLFFGPVAVIGTYFLQVHSLDFQPVLPSVGLGFISAMILNINNMRDIENDKASEKITVAAKLGLKNARIYHTLLTFGMFTCFLQYSFMYANEPWYRYLYVIVFLFQFVILTKIHRKKDRQLDAYLKFTALSGFALAVLFGICINI